MSALVRLQITPDGKSMYGYLFIPKGGGKYPAVLTPPGQEEDHKDQ